MVAVSSPPIVLVTLNQAKTLNLKLSGVAEDEDLELKMEQATAIVLEYIERPTDAAWTATIAAWTVETVPRAVQAAILRQVADLYRFRGDDVEGPTFERGYLSPAVEQLLHRFRDPALA